MQNLKADKPNSKTRATTEAPEEFHAVVDALLKLERIEAELCGSWLWIDGDTYPHREALKAASCLWNCTKKRWYRRHTEGAGVDGLAADHLPAGRRKAAKVNTWPMLEPPAARNRSAAKLFSRPFGQP